MVSGNAIVGMYTTGLPYWPIVGILIGFYVLFLAATYLVVKRSARASWQVSKVAALGAWCVQMYFVFWGAFGCSIVNAAVLQQPGCRCLCDGAQCSSLLAVQTDQPSQII